MFWLAIACTVLGGILSWTFFEYAVHRWLFHGLGVAHHMEVHHMRPWGKYVVPLRLVGPVAALLSAPLWLAGWEWVAAWNAGLVAGWRWYEYLHARFHDGKLRDEPPDPWDANYLAKLWLRHQSHHRFDHPGNFGVTTSFWDHLFRTEEKVTYAPPEPVKQVEVQEPSTGDALAGIADAAGFKRTGLGAVSYRDILGMKVH